MFTFEKIDSVLQLNFPAFDYQLKNSENKTSIFDVIRKKYVVLQPEEWVRQHCVHFLISEKKYPKSLMNVEKHIKINNLIKRYDIVVFNSNGEIFLVVECKAPNIKITQDTFDQIARYNLALNAQFLMVTNGLQHFYCQMDFSKKRYSFLKDIPNYKFSN